MYFLPLPIFCVIYMLQVINKPVLLSIEISVFDSDFLPECQLVYLRVSAHPLYKPQKDSSEGLTVRDSLDPNHEPVRTFTHESLCADSSVSDESENSSIDPDSEGRFSDKQLLDGLQHVVACLLSLHLSCLVNQRNSFNE